MSNFSFFPFIILYYLYSVLYSIIPHLYPLFCVCVSFNAISVHVLWISMSLCELFLLFSVFLCYFDVILLLSSLILIMYLFCVFFCVCVSVCMSVCLLFPHYFSSFFPGKFFNNFPLEWYSPSYYYKLRYFWTLLI